MAVQPPLFDMMEIPPDAERIIAGAYRRTDPETSKEAARSINASSLEYQVYQFLLNHGPSILDEVIRGLKLQKVTASPRFKKLEDAGYAERTGRKRPGESGVGQTEWRALPHAHN